MLVDISHRLFVFDCDGTLVDSQHNIIAAMGAAWARHDLPAPLAAEVRRIVGLTLEVAIARLLPEHDDAKHRALAADYREIVHGLRVGNAQGTAEEPLFPGIRDLIEDLAAPEIFLGVATGKNLRGLEHTLAVHGLRDRFHTLQTADLCRSKPDGDNAACDGGDRHGSRRHRGHRRHQLRHGNGPLGRNTAIGVAWAITRQRNSPRAAPMRSSTSLQTSGWVRRLTPAA
jgi:phosphoglycolate phosphatase-like HAD superfamily hydrolase